MIKSFACKETEKVMFSKGSRRFPKEIKEILDRAIRKLILLNAAESVQELISPPSNNLKKLSGKMQNYHSIRINDQWRICFEWCDGNAYDVQIIDYH